MDDAGQVCCTPLTATTAMSAEQAEQVAPLLKALADPVRLRLISLLASASSGEACVCDLNDAFDLTQATISHHLKVLHTAGLLDREKRGVWVYYAVRREALTAVAGLFDAGAPAPGMSRAGAPMPGMSRAGAPAPGMSRAGAPAPGMSRAGAPVPA